MSLAPLALAELHRRREVLAGSLQRREITRAAADALAARWCGIAAWFGATLPDELRPYDGWQLWTDHAPREMSAAAWRTELAHEARRAARSAHAAAPTADRTRTLIRLAADLSLAAGLPPIDLEPEQNREAA